MSELMDASERVLVKYPLFKFAVARIEGCFGSYGTTAEPECCPIVGESGSGKTTIISYFASLHPRIDHKCGLEIPVLLAKVPARPTVKSFAETLLYQLGDPLWMRSNTVGKSIRLRELLRRCGVRLLALDEFQHFVDARRANIPNEVADWLKEQVEEAGLSIVVLGLQRCLEVLKQNEQLRRRFGATLRVGAFRWESPRGYLCRVASAHGYDSPQWLAHLAGFLRATAGLDREDHGPLIAHVLRLELEEWLAMSYRPVQGAGRFAQRMFCGRMVRADQFNYRRPRICPNCLGERPIWWAVWDLGLVAACPSHRCLLINQCPACGKDLAWRRPAVERCRCGADLRGVTGEAANPDLIAISTLIYHAAGFSPSTAAERELDDHYFPPELRRLALGSLLRLIRFLGLMGEDEKLRRKQRPFRRTDLITAIQASRAATAALKEWPRPFRQALRAMVPERVENSAVLKLGTVFENFYRHLFHVLPRNEFGFLHEAFEAFVVEEWKGLVRGQQRRLSIGTREKSMWISATRAEKRARIISKRLEDLVRQGKLEGMFSKPPRGRKHTECWIKRASLDQWIVTRDAEAAQYMSRPEAKRTLGLHHITVLRVAQAGLIRHVQGLEPKFPLGVHFIREDVTRIKQAFEKHAVPVMEYSKPGELIALRHAMGNYLGRDSGLATVIRAVVDGELVPVAYTNRFRGITGYLFSSDQPRRYRTVRGIEAHPEGFLNYREAAAVLGVKTPVIRGLVAQGILSAAARYRFGLSKLVPAGDVQRFAEQYVATTVLAKRFNLNSWSFIRCLKQLGTPLLAVPISDAGRKPALFLLKKVAAEVRIFPPRNLRDSHVPTPDLVGPFLDSSSALEGLGIARPDMSHRK